MSTKMLFLTIVTAAAAAPAAHAAPGAVARALPSVVEIEGTAARMSDAALGQILASPNIHLAATARPRPFVQESGPTWVQWRAQVKR